MLLEMQSSGRAALVADIPLIGISWLSGVWDLGHSVPLAWTGIPVCGDVVVGLQGF